MTGKISLHNGDCLDIMKEIPDQSINLVLVDLPYAQTANKWDVLIPFPDLWEAYLRIGKPNAVYLFTATQPFTSLVVSSNLALFRCDWVWLKNRGSNFANTVREPFKEHESILMFSKGKWTYNKQMQERTGGGLDRVKYEFGHITDSDNYGNFEGRRNVSLPDLRVPSSWQKFNCEVGLHPTQKPVALMEYLIKTYSNEGDTVLDNCMGSGTTGVACVNLNRNFIGIEKEEKYFAIAKERIEATSRGESYGKQSTKAAKKEAVKPNAAVNDVDDWLSNLN